MREYFQRLFSKYRVIKMAIPRGLEQSDMYFCFCNILNFPAVYWAGYQYIADVAEDFTLLETVVGIYNDKNRA